MFQCLTGLLFAQHVFGAVQHPFFIVGQGPESLAVYLVQDPINLGSEISLATQIHLISGTWRGGLDLFLGPAWQLNTGGARGKTPLAVMDIAIIEPANQHAAQMGRMCKTER